MKSINKKSNEEIISIFSSAILNSYSHSCQIFDKKKGYNRDFSNIGCLELINFCIQSKSKHVAIIYRNDSTNFGFKHYEFSLSDHKYYIVIKVNLENAEMIFKDHSILLLNSDTTYSNLK